jgi:hypothetical protein
MRRIIKVVYYDDAKDVLGREVEFARQRALQYSQEKAQEDREEFLSGLSKGLKLNVFGEDMRHKDPLCVASDDYPDHDFAIGKFYLDDEGAGLDYFLRSYGIRGVWDTIRDSLAGEALQTPEGEALRVDWGKAASGIRASADQLESLLDAKESEGGTKYQGLFAYKHAVPAATDPVTDPLPGAEDRRHGEGEVQEEPRERLRGVLLGYLSEAPRRGERRERRGTGGVPDLLRGHDVVPPGPARYSGYLRLRIEGQAEAHEGVACGRGGPLCLIKQSSHNMGKEEARRLAGLFYYLRGGKTPRLTQRDVYD